MAINPLSQSPVLPPRLLLCFAVAVVAGCLLHYWSIFFSFLLNAPDSDDYVDILWFFEIYTDADSLTEWLYALFLPIHEHITVASHLIYAVHFALFGEINFAHYILIGQAIMLSICLTLAGNFSERMTWPIRLALAVGIFFNLSYWHSSFWAMTAVSNQIVILFALLAASAYARQPNRLWLPMLLALASCFSQANGMAILLSMMACNIYYYCRDKESIAKPLQIMCCVTFIAVLAFHISHQNPFASDHHLDHQALSTEPELIHLYQRDISNTSRFTLSLFDGLKSLVIVSGASAFNDSQRFLAAALGVTLILFWCWVLWKKHPIDRFTFIALCFTALSIGLIAAGRGSASAELTAMLFRYRMYSFLLIALSAHQLLRITGFKPSIIVCIFFTACCFQALSRQHIPAMADNHQMLTSTYHHWLVDGGYGRSSMSIYPPNKDKRIQAAFTSRRYNPINGIDKKNRPLSMETGTTPQALCQHLYLSINQNSQAVGTIQAYSKRPRAAASELSLSIDLSQLEFRQPLYVLLCGKKHHMHFLLEPAIHQNTSTGQPHPQLILKRDLPRGQYQALIGTDKPRLPLGTFKIK